MVELTLKICFLSSLFVSRHKGARRPLNFRNKFHGSNYANPVDRGTRVPIVNELQNIDVFPNSLYIIVLNSPY